MHLNHLSFSEAPWFCQDFSWHLGFPKRLDRKFQGEIWQFERRELANLSLKIAVKPTAIFKPLIFNNLQNTQENWRFCQDVLPIYIHAAIRLKE